MTIAIAAATATDLPAILDLLERSKLPRAGLEGHLKTTLVARDGTRLVGCAAIESYGTAGLLRSVAVDAALRSQGLGQRLTRAALDLAQGHGIKMVYLLTETAGDFFPRFGFQPVTRAQVASVVQQSVEFTSACPASALVMQLELAT